MINWCGRESERRTEGNLSLKRDHPLVLPRERGERDRVGKLGMTDEKLMGNWGREKARGKSERRTEGNLSLKRDHPLVLPRERERRERRYDQLVWARERATNRGKPLAEERSSIGAAERERRERERKQGHFGNCSPQMMGNLGTTEEKLMGNWGENLSKVESSVARLLDLEAFRASLRRPYLLVVAFLFFEAFLVASSMTTLPLPIGSSKGELEISYVEGISVGITTKTGCLLLFKRELATDLLLL
ncbi:hypothetical protein TorRG33x02_330730 [Trema orientale]|uniref:Transmembrane protein n=1 Tax=Trema orientale TaxID=63057 RepID=A0A2P5B6Q1_TREOI|nr:hypothetical protein TorRG33x02_330730 [Trema orientale]